MNSFSILITSIFLLVWSASSQADQLMEIDNHETVELFNKLEIVAAQDLYSNARLPMSIKIIRIRSDGECDGSPQSCPMQHVYVAVSSHDEYPDRKVYELPPAYEWDFNGWEHVPASDGPNDYYVMKLTRKVIAPDTSVGWWQNQAVRIRANLHNAVIEAIP